MSDPDPATPDERRRAAEFTAWLRKRVERMHKEARKMEQLGRYSYADRLWDQLQGVKDAADAYERGD